MKILVMSVIIKFCDEAVIIISEQLNKECFCLSVNIEYQFVGVIIDNYSKQ